MLTKTGVYMQVNEDLGQHLQHRNLERSIF
jgi:hypothetical protein